MSIHVSPAEVLNLPTPVPPSRSGNEPGAPAGSPLPVGGAARFTPLAEDWRAFRDANLSESGPITEATLEAAFRAGVSAVLVRWSASFGGAR